MADQKDPVAVDEHELRRPTMRMADAPVGGQRQVGRAVAEPQAGQGRRALGKSADAAAKTTYGA
ncbi:MAG: hypothetical protein ACR2ML_08190 [Solirubrobacteraceae bacterium]